MAATDNSNKLVCGLANMEILIKTNCYMEYFARVSHDPWLWGLNAWLRSSVCVSYSVASMLQDFIASNMVSEVNRAKKHAHKQ